MGNYNPTMCMPYMRFIFVFKLFSSKYTVEGFVFQVIFYFHSIVQPGSITPFFLFFLHFKLHPFVCNTKQHTLQAFVNPSFPPKKKQLI